MQTLEELKEEKNKERLEYISKLKEKYILKKCVSKNDKAEIEIEKSKFISFSYFVKTKEDAEKIIKNHNEKYSDATHNCFAYIIDENIKLMSDDGEPSGTAGMPMLSLLEKEGYTHTLVISTRYFGGTLLGTGGLVRAYTESTKAVLEKSNPSYISKGFNFRVNSDYSDFEKIKQYLENKKIEVEKTKFTEKVEFEFTLFEKEEGIDLKNIFKSIEILEISDGYLII